MTRKHARVFQDYAIAYLRVSSDLQENIGGQLLAIREQAAKLGLSIPDDGVYMDEALSRDYFLRREGLQAMLERAKDPYCKAVIVNWYNRLYTSDNQQAIFTALRKAQVRLFNAEGIERNRGDHEGELVDFVDGWMSKGQVKFIRESVRDSHRAKAYDGRFVGKPGYGVDVVPVYKLPCKGACGPAKGAECEIVHGNISEKNETVWVINDEKLRILGTIYKWFADGMTTSQVHLKCIEMGWGPGIKVTKRGKNKGRAYGGKPWSKANLMLMIGNEFYKGEMIYGRRRTVHEGDKVYRVMTDPETWIRRTHVFGPIIPVEIWEKANRNIKLRKNTKTDDDRKNPVQLWDGFVWCARCGWKMHPSPRPETRSGVLFDYYCNSRSSEYSRCTVAQSVPGHWLVGLLRGDGPPRHGGPVDVRLELDDRVDNTGEIKLVQEELSLIPAELARVERLAKRGYWGDDEAGDEAALAAKQEVLTRQSALSERLAELLSQPEGAVLIDELPPAAESFFELVQDPRIPVEVRRAELARVVERVWIDRPTIRFVLRKDFIESTS